MSFTDEDLKRLKERKRSPRISLAVDAMEALLARLEAAEALAYETKNEHLHFIGLLYRNPEKDHSSKDCRICLNDEAWRKAAGKDGV